MIGISWNVEFLSILLTYNNFRLIRYVMISYSDCWLYLHVGRGGNCLVGWTRIFSPPHNISLTYKLFIKWISISLEKYVLTGFCNDKYLIMSLSRIWLKYKSEALDKECLHVNATDYCNNVTVEMHQWK